MESFEDKGIVQVKTLGIVELWKEGGCLVTRLLYPWNIYHVWQSGATRMTLRGAVTSF